MNPNIISNCEYVLGRQADVQVITEYDRSSGSWKAHAVHFSGTVRISVAVGTGSTDAEALRELHKETAHQVLRHNEATGVLQLGNINATPLARPSLYDQDFETTVAYNSDTEELNDIDDVISLSDDEERSPLTPDEAADWNILPGRQEKLREMLREQRMMEFRNQLRKRDGDVCSHPPELTEELMATKPSLMAVSPPRPSVLPALASAADTSSCADAPLDAAAPVHAEARTGMPPRPSPVTTRRPLEDHDFRPIIRPVPSRPVSTMKPTTDGRGEAPHCMNEIGKAHRGKIVLNVTWAGRQGVARASHVCHLHAGLLKDLACHTALNDSHLFVGEDVPAAALDGGRHYMTSNDGKISLIATIKTLKQGNRIRGVPHNVRYLAYVLCDQAVPEFNIEVQSVLPPPEAR